MAREKTGSTPKQYQDTTPPIGTRKDLFAAEEQRRATLRYLTPDVIDPNPDQPRQIIHREGLEELKKSIAERGILQPLLAIKGTEGHVTLVAGQRRLLAVRELGLKLVPVMVIDYRPDVAFDAIIENIQREALDPIDEGEAFQRLSDERNYSHAEIGARIGKSKQYVTDRIRLAHRLTPRTKELLSAVVQAVQNSSIKTNARAFDCEISNEDVVLGASKAKFTIARVVSFLPDNLQEAAMAELESEVTRLGRRLTTREVEELVARFKAEAPRRRLGQSTEIGSDGLIQMSFIEGAAAASEQNQKKIRTRKSPSARRVDGRQLESFKALAELAQLPADRALNLDIDATIKMMEADLERLRRLKSEE
ncbi:MAG: ParB/RepB/Spo0J family partition protein [Chloroflexota bacterium]|nr:ParB/RepB/Spo0J family partition protein [Chloroflexota bacterium]